MYRPKKNITEQKNYYPADKTVLGIFGAHTHRSDTGESVTKETAASSVSWYAGLKIVANRMGAIKKPVYQDTDTGREKQKRHPVYKLINEKANPYTKSLDFFRTLTIDYLNGNGYGFIERDEDFFPRHLHNINNECVVPIALFDGPKLERLYYSVNTSEGQILVASDDMIHVKDLPMALDDHGVDGLDVIATLRNNFSLGSVLEKYTAFYFKNGTHVTKYLKIPQWMTDEQKAELKEVLKDYDGLENSHKTLAISGGAELIPFVADNSTAQLNETKQGLEASKAVLLGVPSNLIGDRQGLSQYGSLEEMNLSFLTHTLDPLYANLEAELMFKLLTNEERESGLYIEFDRNSILQGNPEKAQQQLKDEFLSGGISWEQRAEKNNRSTKREGTFVLPNGYQAWTVKPQEDVDISKMASLMAQVTSKQLPPETAKAMIAAAYPTLDEAKINSIVNPCIGFEIPKPDFSVTSPMQDEQKAQVDEPEEVQRGEMVMKNTIERLRRRFLKAGEIDDLAIDEAFEGLDTEHFKRALDPLRDELSSVLKEQRKQVMEEKWDSNELLSTIWS